uniref:Large polyvalent protein associated domain-containing protein n=4 Tax=viral metagenome TaxID=1070528 RepID=A0A6M3KU68_9ZZZZ
MDNVYDTLAQQLKELDISLKKSLAPKKTTTPFLDYQMEKAHPVIPKVEPPKEPEKGTFQAIENPLQALQWLGHEFMAFREKAQTEAPSWVKGPAEKLGEFMRSPGVAEATMVIPPMMGVGIGEELGATAAKFAAKEGKIAKDIAKQAKIKAVVPAQIAKEPWQMTRTEYTASLKNQLVNEAKARGEVAFQPIKKTEPGYRLMVEGRQATRRRAEEFGPAIHREKVAKAHSEGKPVPPNVLKEYGLEAKVPLAKPPVEVKALAKEPMERYLHGRAGTNDLMPDFKTHEIYVSQEADIARMYAGKKGSIWELIPKGNAKIFNATSSSEADIVVNTLRKQYKNDSLRRGPYTDLATQMDDEIANYGKTKAWERLKNSLQPKDIVEDEGLYGNTDFVNWLWENFQYEFVKVNRGGVAYNPDAFIIRRLEQPIAEPPVVEGVKPPMREEDLIVALKAKGLDGTADKLNRNLITRGEAEAQLAGKLPTPVVGGFPNPADFAAELKGQGVGRQESWSRWIQRTSLNPGMDAKDWYKIYDSVTPTAIRPPLAPVSKATKPLIPEAPMVEAIKPPIVPPKGPQGPIVPPMGGIPPIVPPAKPPIPPTVPPTFPEGTARAVALAEEKVRQASPGAISKALDAFPVTRPLYRFLNPAKGLTHDQHVAWVAKNTATSEYLTKAFPARVEALRGLDTAFGPGFTTGAKANLQYIGPAERAKSDLVGRGIDVLMNPDHYALSQLQKDAVAKTAAYSDEFLASAVEQYGAQIGKFPIKPGATFVPNVDVSEPALEALGNAWIAAKVGRAKTRVWEDAISRQMHTPSFKPETNLETLFAASDEAKGTLIASEVFKAKLGGLNKLQVMEETHPKLATKMESLRKRLISLRGSAGRLETRLQEGVDGFLAGPMDDVDLVALRDALDVKISRGAMAGADLARINKEIQGVRAQIRALQPYWKAANLQPYRFVQKGVFRYFPIDEAKSLEQLLETSRNPALSLAWEVRNIAFNLDLSPITGVHLPLGFLADPIGATKQLVKGIKSGASLHNLSRQGLAENIAKDPSWLEFAAVSGRPVGPTATEFAGGILNRIPGYNKLNEGMFTLVTYRSKGMFDDIVKGLEKAGIPHNEAIVVASETTHKAIPLVDYALLGMSQARSKLLQSVTISPSFLLRPPQLMGEATKALAKAGLRQPLTANETMALRTMLTMAGTIEVISVGSAVIDASIYKRDVGKAAIEGLTDMSIHLLDGRKIPIGGPFRSFIMALKPQWVNREMDYMMPFANVPRWLMGKLTPLLGTQYDLIRNKDYFNRQIVTGEFPVNILQFLAYEFEGAVPLSIAAWLEGARTGGELGRTAEEAVTQLMGTSLYERPGPFSLRSEWRDELRGYLTIPTDPLELKGGPTRTQYREKNKEVDAKLFITGYVSTVATDSAGRIAERLIAENRIDFKRISGIQSEMEDMARYEKAGKLYTKNTPTTRLIKRLMTAQTSKSVAPTQTPPDISEPTPYPPYKPERYNPATGMFEPQ